MIYLKLGITSIYFLTILITFSEIYLNRVEEKIKWPWGGGM